MTERVGRCRGWPSDVARGCTSQAESRCHVPGWIDAHVTSASTGDKRPAPGRSDHRVASTYFEIEHIVENSLPGDRCTIVIDWARV